MQHDLPGWEERRVGAHLWVNDYTSIAHSHFWPQLQLRRATTPRQQETRGQRILQRQREDRSCESKDDSSRLWWQVWRLKHLKHLRTYITRSVFWKHIHKSCVYQLKWWKTTFEHAGNTVQASRWGNRSNRGCWQASPLRASISKMSQQRTGIQLILCCSWHTCLNVSCAVVGE